jgi:tetratricopeptide (TPR) repeat protein
MIYEGDPCWQSLTLATFIFTGRFPEEEPDPASKCLASCLYKLKGTLTPSPVELDPSYAKIGFPLFDEALTHLGKNKHPHGKHSRSSEQYTTARWNQRNIYIYEYYGDALLKMGHREAAIAKWQYILDTYPKYAEFDRIEKKMHKALGIM